MNLAQDARDLVAELTALGIPAACDPRDARVPGAIVYPSTLTLATMAGGREDRWTIILIGSAGGMMPALDSLSDMADKLAGLVPEWEAITLADRNLSADPLPALTATITLESETP